MFESKNEVYQMLEQSKQLPQLPPYGDEILAILEENDRFDIDELAATVEKNPDIAAFYLKQVHKILSVDFLSVKDAILFLGSNSSRNLLVYYFISLFHLGRKKSDQRIFDLRHYWLHVLGTAIGSELLLTLTGREGVFKLFTYGLLHDMGIDVLDTCMPEKMDEIYGHIRAGMHQTVAEKKALGGLTHADIGGWLCDRWGFGTDIAHIVKFHHTPHLASELTQDLAILYVADSISSVYYQRLLNMDTQLHEIDKRVLKLLNLNQSDIEHIEKALPGNVENFRERFIPSTL